MLRWKIYLLKKLSSGSGQLSLRTVEIINCNCWREKNTGIVLNVSHFSNTMNKLDTDSKQTICTNWSFFTFRSNLWSRVGLDMCLRLQFRFQLLARIELRCFLHLSPNITKSSYCIKNIESDTFSLKWSPNEIPVKLAQKSAKKLKEICNKMWGGMEEWSKDCKTWSSKDFDGEE